MESVIFEGMNLLEGVNKVFNLKNAFLCKQGTSSKNGAISFLGGTDAEWNSADHIPDSISQPIFFCKTYADGLIDHGIKPAKEAKPIFKSGFLITDKFTEISLDAINLKEKNTSLPLVFTASTNRPNYHEKFNQIKQHIQLGDIYEMNYCIQFFAENVEIDAVDVFLRLNKISAAPFACLMKQDQNYLICASPERFLRKENRIVMAQPIKGTIKRSDNHQEDELLKKQLFNDPKERSENVMIVDLVRNDLSKVASPGSVKVDELFGIYTFPTVHQMISSVSCEIREAIKLNEILGATFPMGSMTGAPKLKAMQLIEKYENFNRGLYSGTVGMIHPSNDFDLNVIIRSLFYDAKNKYLSICVGSAITINSDSDYEYDECLLKAQALLQAVNGIIQ